jgi:hypothetical protein
MSQPEKQAKPLLVLDKSSANKKSGALNAWAEQYTIWVPAAFVMMNKLGGP